jgi:regulator of RNase E activity RraA
MRANIRPLYPEAVVVGRAVTVQAMDVFERIENPYDQEIKAIECLTPGTVLVASTNRSTRTCLWGELLSTAAQIQGAHGAVIDGYIRDAQRIIKMQFPVFATGFKPVNSNGRSIVVSYQRPVNCGDVIVQPGDIIFGDFDGVIAIPQKKAQQVIAWALNKVQSENKTREALLQGYSLRDVYDQYGVL